MSKLFFHRLLLGPIFLFGALLALFAYSEHRRERDATELQGALDGLLTVTTWISHSNVVWAFHDVVRSMEAGGVPSSGLTPFFGTLREHAHAVDLRLRQSIMLSDNSDFMDKGAWAAFREDMGVLEAAIARDNHDYPLIVKTLEDLKENLNRASLSEALMHQNRVKKVLDEIHEEEKIRAVVVWSVVLGGGLLIVLLLSSLRRYKLNMERARAAERSNALFVAALQTTDVGVLIRDIRKPTRPVIFVNGAFTKMTGYAFEDVSSDSSEFLFGWKTDPASKESYRRAIRQNESATLDLLLYRKDGSPFWSEWHLSPLLDEGGQAAYYVSLLTDKTAIKTTQEDLLQAKAAAEQAGVVKTTFLAMMSHEVRTPINGVLGVLKLLEETELDAEQRHLVSVARTSGNVLHGLINDILDYAKLEAGKLTITSCAFSLRALMNEVLALGHSILGKGSVSLSLDFPQDADASWYWGDDARIRQVLLNLLSNAIKFTEVGGITLRVLCLMPQDVLGRPGHLLRFEVQDTGIGIEASDQESLFQEFTQVERTFNRRRGGTGLGLAICRRLITMMGGEIGVESQAGKGSRFWFMLPLPETAPGAAALSPTEEKGTDRGACCRLLSRRYKILLVEDNETNRLIATRYLEKGGFSVAEAVNGREAVEKAEKDDFDLILMDISMPEMDGIEATRRLRALGGHKGEVPIIALTAHAMEGDRELCLSAGMNDFLNKPLDRKVLISRMEKWLRISEGAEEGGEEAPALQAPSSFDVPLFDGRVLQRMKDDLGGEAVERVTRTFLEDSAGKMGGIKGQTLEAIGEMAHALKGCSGSCGLTHFSRLMADLESAAKKRDEEQVKRLQTLALDVYAISKARLEKERQNFI